MWMKDDDYSVEIRCYQSPEILLSKPYTFSCDIFSIGVILFVLLTGYPPFQIATIDDRWYRKIARGKMKKFWKQHRGCGLGPYAIDLITKMLAFDPNTRITIDDIKKHAWYNDEIVNNGKDLEMIIQLKQRQMELKRLNNPRKMEILVANERWHCCRIESMKNSMIPKPLPDDEIVGIFDVFTTYCAYTVLHHIEHFCQKQLNFKPTIDKNTCSMIIRTSFDATCEILVCVYKYNEYNCNLVKFIKMRGNNLFWTRTFEQFMTWMLPVLNGVPQNIVEEKFIIDRDDERLLKRYFTSPRDTDKKSKPQQEEPIPG